MANQEHNDERDLTPQLSPLYLLLNSAFTFWFGTLMAIISFAVIIMRISAVLAEGFNTYNTYHLGILPATRDIAAFIPVVSLLVAFTLHARSFAMTMADYIAGLSKKRRQRDRAEAKAEGKTEGLTKARNWYNRKVEAERNGEPFTEPFPGDEETVDA